MILRLPLAVGGEGAVHLNLSDGGSVVSIPVKGCDGHFCIAYLQLGTRLRNSVKNGVAVTVSYNEVVGGAKNTSDFIAPLDGLSEALGAI